MATMWSSAFTLRPSQTPGIQRASSLLLWSRAASFRANTVGPIERACRDTYAGAGLQTESVR
eukprot:363207-Heterocapsa_arctica.AAC.1